MCTVVFLSAADKYRALRARWLQRKVAVPNHAGCMTLLMSTLDAAMHVHHLVVYSSNKRTDRWQKHLPKQKWNKILSDDLFLLSRVPFVSLFAGPVAG